MSNKNKIDSGIAKVFEEYDKAIFNADQAKVGLGMTYFVNKMKSILS